MKRLLLVVCTLGILLILLGGCRNAPLTEEQARQIAETKFRQFCANFHLLPSEFAAPVSTNVGGAQFAFEWKDKTPGHDFSILVSIDKDGAPNATYLGGRPGLPDPTKLPPSPN